MVFQHPARGYDLTFYSFPEHEWMGLRTTNSIERVNKEFKGRTKPMEVLAGERSAYKLLLPHGVED
jgi:putative transposase